MTIRTRLTLWYAGILFFSLLLITGLSYHKFHQRPEEGIDSDEDFQEVAGIVVWCGVPAALLGLIGGWWLMRKALAPVTALTEAAERIHEHNLQKQLPRTFSGDELDRLTEVFNAMTTRLDNSFQRIREFTLHASHELKTPLTVLHGQLETALRDETCIPEQRELMFSQLEEVQRLTRIVDGLTLLAKADSGQIVLSKTPVRFDELVREAYADALVLAQPQQIRVTLNKLDKATVLGDRDRLRQLLLNLTDNAIKYNQPGGQVTFDLCTEEKYAQLVIANAGAGIAPELLPRVFDPFFRGDTAHNSGTEGCGLGLSIARWIVTAHGGDIRIASVLEKQTVVAIHLPRHLSHN